MSRRIKNNVVAVIMAGGYGERFWPKSRRSCPKQFIDITGAGSSIIQQTYRRISSVVPPRRIYVVTHRSQVPLLRRQLPRLSEKKILAEPQGRNTAPCLGWAALRVQKDYGDPVMIVLPADQLIQNEASYIGDIRMAYRFVKRQNVLLTFGVPPSSPHTGYGYIEQGARQSGRIFRVRKFKEKPDLKTAKRFVASGRYYWNSGMFVFRASEMLASMKKHAPYIYRHLKRLEARLDKKDFNIVLNGVYDRIKKESIDYAVMEKSGKVFVLEARFGWSDIGSWASVYDLNRKSRSENCLLGPGEKLIQDSEGCLIVSDSGLIAASGVSGLIIVKDKDAVLVAGKDGTENIKKIVEKLSKTKNGKRFI